MLSARFFRFFRYLSLRTIKQTIQATAVQRLPGLASEMAYNAMLALFPAILAVLTAIGLFLPLKITFQTLASQVSEVVPEEALGLVEGFASAISGTRNPGLFSFSFIFAIWASSGALTAAMNALDQIHQIPREQARPFWRARLVALWLTIGSLLLLLLAVALFFLSDVVVRNIADKSGIFETNLLHLWQWLTLPLVLVIMSTLFAFIYRFGPSHWTRGQPIMPGAVLAAVFWAILSGGFRIYLRHFGSYNQIYGVVGGVIILLLWLYMSSLVLLIGEQLNVSVGKSMKQSAAKKQSRSNNPKF